MTEMRELSKILRNSKQNLFATYDSIDEVLEYAKRYQGVSTQVVAMIAFNTTLEIIASKIALYAAGKCTVCEHDPSPTCSNAKCPHEEEVEDPPSDTSSYQDTGVNK